MAEVVLNSVLDVAMTELDEESSTACCTATELLPAELAAASNIELSWLTAGANIIVASVDVVAMGIAVVVEKLATLNATSGHTHIQAQSSVGPLTGVGGVVATAAAAIAVETLIFEIQG